MNRTAAVMAENDEDEQEFERNRWDDEEVYGDQVLGVVLEKGSPRLGGRLAAPDHVLRDGCLRNFDSNLQQFSMDTRCTPTWIGQTHFSDQVADFQGDCWAAISIPTLPSPKQSKSLAMPRDDRRRLDDE